MLSVLQDYIPFLVYNMIIAAASVALTVYDKSAAKKGAWRIPEKMLIGFAVSGGALPMLITMKKIRHKTKHMLFMVGLPAIIFVHVALVIAAVYFFNS